MCDVAHLAAAAAAGEHLQAAVAAAAAVGAAVAAAAAVGAVSGDVVLCNRFENLNISPGRLLAAAICVRVADMQRDKQPHRKAGCRNPDQVIVVAA